MQGWGDGLRAPARSKLLRTQLKSAPTDGNLADKLRKGCIESSTFFLCDFNWEAYVLINPRARPPPSASRGAKILQMDTRGHHLCWGHMSFRNVLQPAPCALPDGCRGSRPRLHRGDSQHPQPCPSQGHEQGSEYPRAAPKLGVDPALGQPSCLDTAPANTGQATNSAQCPVPAVSRSPARPSPVPLSPLTLEPHPHSRRERAGAAAPCALWPATCHKLRTPESINLPGNKNQGK